MMIGFTHDRQVLDLVKNDEHFVLVYPYTPAGRMAAKGAVREWLIDCELDFDRHDAAERIQSASETAHRVQEPDILSWLAETEPPRRRRDTPATQPTDSRDTGRAPLRHPAERQTHDGAQSTGETRHETGKAAAGDSAVKVHGSWAAKPTAASTQDAAADALTILFGRH